MSENSALMIGFLIGEIVLILLLVWTYRQLVQVEAIRDSRTNRRLVLSVFVALPILVALFTVPGIVYRIQDERAILPSTGGTAAPTQDGETAPTETVTPLVTAAPTEAEPTTAPPTTAPPTETPTSLPDPPTATPTEAAPTTEPTQPAPTVPQPTRTERPPLPGPTDPPPAPTEQPAPTEPPPPTEQLPTPTDVAPTEPPPTGPPPPAAIKAQPSGELGKVAVTPAPLVKAKEVEISKVGRVPPENTPGTAVPAADNPVGGTPEAAQPTPTAGPPPAPLEPPGGKIVFVCQVFRDTERDQICIINADGSGERRVSNNDQADHNFPALSPDGQTIIYASTAGGDFEIYEMDLIGQARQLTDGEGAAVAPDISPDGSRVVYSRRIEGLNTIWVMQRDGSSPRQVFGPPQGYGWDPVWSPDGSQILFASNLDGTVQLYRIQPDGSGLQKVSSLEGIRGGGDWAPDGGPLGPVIAAYAGEPWQHEIYLMGVDGADLRAITNGGNNLSPSFSPDGSWMAFTSYRDRLGDDHGCEIYIMPVDGSRVARLTNNEYCDWQPRWGP